MLFRFTKFGQTLGLGVRVENIIGVMITDGELNPAKITEKSLFDLKPTKIKGVYTDIEGNYLVETHPALIRSSPKDKKLSKQTVKIGENGQVSLIGSFEFKYRSDETLFTIGRTDFDTFGSFAFYRPIRYRRVGHLSLEYGVDGTVKVIGDWTLLGNAPFRYYFDGRIKKIRNISITYGENGEAILEEIEN